MKTHLWIKSSVITTVTYIFMIMPAFALVQPAPPMNTDFAIEKKQNDAVTISPVIKKMTQAEYDQQIQKYTDQVNATKKILDNPDTQNDAKAQKQAFCSRIFAYQSIAQISQQNITLDLAPAMLMVANSFLERQKQSLTNSGMTEQVFCGAVQ